ncbi:MAG TPA: hypothetical protein PKM21_07530 [Anaerolineales bacterium]|nr:hypothetical protein [Anaerolineales bacterium]
MHAHIIPRQEAIAFLAKPKADWVDRLWDGTGFNPRKYKTPRNTRGPGGAVDLLNLGGYSPAGKLVCVARIGMAPYQNKPAIAAVGADLAPYTAYLMRLAGIGLEHSDLVEFLTNAIQRLRSDLVERGRDFRYLLSLDDPQERLIEGDGVLRCSRAVTGQVYIETGAMHAGMTRSKNQPTRYITDDGQIRSIYQNGVNIAAQVDASGRPVIQEGVKHRFVWVLGEKSSIEYATWRRVLPAWVREPEWGRSGLGWTQPRLLVKRTHLGVAAHGQVNDLVQLAIASFGHLLRFGEELSGEAFAERIAQAYDESNPRTQAVLAGLR